MRFEKDGKKLILFPEGRIDSSNSQAFSDDMFAVLDSEFEGDKTCDLEINLRDVEYMSSAALRVLVKVKKAGYLPNIVEVKDDLYDIFDVTGFVELFNIKKAYRKLSLDGCKQIGKGFCGSVYRIDDDTIVKVYDSINALPVIESEQRNARSAFVKGIPTAISYDIVQVGDKIGTVFELLKAKSFNDLLLESPENIRQITEDYVDFLKTVHATEMDPKTLPSAKDVYLEYLDMVRPYLSEDLGNRIADFIRSYPDDYHAVHGDFQMKNVMLVEDEPMLIDMETFCMGQPVFELSGLYVTYKLFAENDPTNTMDFLGIPNESADLIWDIVFNRYYSGLTEEEKSAKMHEISILALLRFIRIVVGSSLKDSELGKWRIENSRKRLEELL